MEPIDIIPTIEEERPNLFQELEWRKVTEVWKLNDIPTGPNSERAGRRVWILLAKGENNDYIIQSISGTKNTPDKYQVWVHYGGLDAEAREGQEPSKAGYILIDKSKLGRPRRVLTEQERQEIRARHAAGDSINKIAKALHLGTRRIMGALQQT